MDKSYIAVWRLKGKPTVIFKNINLSSTKLIYPADFGIKISNSHNNVELNFPDNYMAAIIEVIR